MFIPIVNYQQPPVTDGLIRFYDPQIEMSTGSILEQSGRAAAVGSGNGYSITTTVPAYVTFLNNQTNRFTVAAATDLDWIDGTVVAWVYLNGTANTNYCWINQRSGITTNTRFSLHANPSANTMGIYNGTNFVTVSTTIDNGLWYCFAAQLSTTINPTFYVNGISVGTAGAGSTIQGSATGKAFEFGNSDAGFINEAWDGRIGQVWNYSRRLLPEEIYQIYQRTRDRYGRFI
jgi:hypothetical protein